MEEFLRSEFLASISLLATKYSSENMDLYLYIRILLEAVKKFLTSLIEITKWQRNGRSFSQNSSFIDENFFYLRPLSVSLFPHFHFLLELINGISLRIFILYNNSLNIMEDHKIYYATMVGPWGKALELHKG